MTQIVGRKECSGGEVVSISVPEGIPYFLFENGEARAERVLVEAIIDADGKNISNAKSRFDGGQTVYVTGEITECDLWDEDPRENCTNGIHFYVSKSLLRKMGMGRNRCRF